MIYSVLTPALVPDSALERKRPNIGDQLILDSIQELIGESHSPEVRLSSWQELGAEDIDRINTTRALILAGANPLHDEYRIAPNLTLENLRRIRVPIIPMGIGLYGEPGKQTSMSETTKDMLREVHSRIEFSSWRCPRTVAYLRRNLPELGDKILMTGCPVVQAGRATRSASPVDPRSGSIAVTVTERGPGWWAREMRILETVRRTWPGRRTVLVLHQQFKPARSNRLLRRWMPARYGGPDDLHAFVARRGMHIARPTSTAEMREVYRECSLHIGSRLHAHLYFLSQNRSSYLFAVDGRAEGFAESLSFPLLDGSEDALEARCDFAAVQRAMAGLWSGPMKSFLSSVQRTLA
jgi:hypothetical protein